MTELSYLDCITSHIDVVNSDVLPFLFPNEWVESYINRDYLRLGALLRPLGFFNFFFGGGIGTARPRWSGP